MKKALISLAGLLLLTVPVFLGEWFAGGSEDWLRFPPLLHKVNPAAPFTLWVFVLISVGGIATLCLLLKPTWFGFAKAPGEAARTPAPTPVWLWIGLVLMGASWIAASDRSARRRLRSAMP